MCWELNSPSLLRSPVDNHPLFVPLNMNRYDEQIVPLLSPLHDSAINTMSSVDICLVDETEHVHQLLRVLHYYCCSYTNGGSNDALYVGRTLDDEAFVPLLVPLPLHHWCVLVAMNVYYQHERHEYPVDVDNQRWCNCKQHLTPTYVY